MEKVTQQQLTSVVADDKLEDIASVWLRLLVFASGKPEESQQ